MRILNTVAPPDPPERIREVLLATDFSPEAQHAAVAAEDLARRYGARLHVLHVVRRESDRAAARPRVEAVARALQGSATVAAVEVGAPAERIVDYARQHHIDLIVVGTHARGGLRRIAQGRLTEALLRHAPCQVLAVKREEAEAEAGAEAPPAGRGERVARAAARALRRCLLCAQPSADLICTTCSARVQGEAIERKRREMSQGT